MAQTIIHKANCVRVCAALALVFAVQPALADTAAGAIDVNAVVTNACTVGTAPVNFGAVDVTLPGQQDATGSLDVTCTSGATWAAAADGGGTSGATLTARRMRTAGGGQLTYHLYTAADGATEWGNGTLGTASIGGTGTGTVDHRPILGRVFRNQVAPAGTYSDRITVTVSY